jgi:cytochrome c-type biogenesis protein CcmE
VFKRKKFLIGGVVLMCALGYLLYLGFGNTLAYYSTVSELISAGDTVYEQDIRVNGTVVPGSINADPVSLDYAFVIADDGGNLPVVYHGVMQDGFEESADLVVRGIIQADGILYATEILIKCPSKYEPEEPD